MITSHENQELQVAVLMLTYYSAVTENIYTPPSTDGIGISRGWGWEKSLLLRGMGFSGYLIGLKIANITTMFHLENAPVAR